MFSVFGAANVWDATLATNLFIQLADSQWLIDEQKFWITLF